MNLRKFIAWFLLLSSPYSWGACVASTTGQWLTGANWTGCTGTGGIPASTDAITVGNNFTMTCSGNGCVGLTLTTAGVGNSGTNCNGHHCNVEVANGGSLAINDTTVASAINLVGTGGLHVASGGTLTAGGSGTSSTQYDVNAGAGTAFVVDNGATFNMNGGVSVASTGYSSMGGHTICTPGNTSTSYQWRSSGVTTTDGTTVQFLGPNYTTTPAVFETVAGQSAGGNCRITNGGGNNPKVIMGNLILNNCGDTTNDCATYNLQTTPQSFVQTGPILLIHSGKFNISTDSGDSNATTFNLDKGLDIRNSNAASHTALTLATANTNSFTGTRLVANVTCDVETGGTTVILQVLGHGYNLGYSLRAGEASDTMGTVTYNCEPTFSNANATSINHRNSYIALDTASSGQTILETDYSQAYSITDSIFDVFGNNAHTIVGLGASRSSTSNHYDYNFITGEGYEPGDSGEYVDPTGPTTASYNILVNGNQNLMVLNQAATEVLTAEHNTLYRQSSGYTGDTANAATTFVSWQYNAMSLPFYNLSSGKCSSYMSGITGGQSLVSFTGLTMNNNGYWQMPNSGDTGADTCTPPTGTGIGGLGTFPGAGPIQMSQTIRGTVANKAATAGTTAGTLVCSGCTGTTGFQQAGELAVEHGDIVWDITKAGCAYVNTITNGTTLVTATGTNCTVVPASGDNFDIRKTWENPGYYYGENAAYGLNDIHAVFSYANSGVDTCDWYNTLGGGLTCTHSGTTLDTNILAVAHAFISINGYDYGSGSSLAGTNCAANCPQVVTPIVGLTVPKGMSWLRAQYVVMNSVYKNLDCRTSTCKDTGAWLVFPSAILAGN